MTNYSEIVLNQFFQEFYTQRIENVKTYSKNYNSAFDIPITLFWFSIIDFYGGLYYVGIKNELQTYNNRSLKFASKNSFKEFIKVFFPNPENELGDFLYTIFRSGLVHQLSPKNGGLFYLPDNPKLIWIDKQMLPSTHIITANINIFKLEELTYNGYLEFRRKIETNQIPEICKNIAENLITKDIFEDVTILNSQYLKLSEGLREYLTIIR